MRIEYALWVAGGARCVTQKGARVFIDRWPIESFALSCEQALVTKGAHFALGVRALVAQHHECRDGLHLRRKSLDQRQEGLVEEQDARLGVVEDVNDLLV